MTPALLALSRAYLALPGAPVRDMIAAELVCRDLDGHPNLRDRNGLLWCPYTEVGRPAPWVLDLTDAATGGVMLDRFARVGGFGVAFDPSVAVGRWLAGDWFDLVHEGATLAEAVARAAVALGRAS